MITAKYVSYSSPLSHIGVGSTGGQVVGGSVDLLGVITQYSIYKT